VARAKDEAAKLAAETEKAEKEAMQARLEAQEKSLGEARENEKKLRGERARLEEEKKEIELTVQRKLDEERKTIEEKLLKKFSDEHFMKLKERDKQITDLNRLVDEMKRKGQQGVLTRQFKDDELEPVPKGEMGADMIHTVYSPSRQKSGVILWEAKNTQNWAEKWVEKLKEDQRAAGANIAVLISKALPRDFENFGEYKGIWLTCHASAIGLATALRQQLIEVNFANQALIGKDDKMEAMYSYLSSPSFRQKVETIVETFTQMHTQLQKEKTAMKTIWDMREMQIQRVIDSTTRMYGEMKGIIGQTMPDIENLQLDDGEERKLISE
jgi:hypothetical protein